LFSEQKRGAAACLENKEMLEFVLLQALSLGFVVPHCTAPDLFSSWFWRSQNEREK
jgi:hypothetical protein